MSHSTNTPLMITDSISADAINSTCAVPENVSDLNSAGVTRQSRRARLQRAAERGMVTAEYAVGILAAITLALVMMGIFKNGETITALLHFVTGLIGKLSNYIQ